MNRPASDALCRSAFKGKKVLITAGPTREYLDSVRYLSNASSGKMGLALANRFKSYGAKVFLIRGPGLAAPKDIPSSAVVSALQMLKEVQKRFKGSDFFVSAAAVSDYRPRSLSPIKLKKDGKPRSLELLLNPDILAFAGRNKGGRFCVGFALEDRDGIARARRKMLEKNCDMILLNDPGSMEADFIRATVLSRDGKVRNLGRITKEKCAEKLCQAIATNFQG